MHPLKRSIGLNLAAVIAATIGAAMLISMAAAQAPPAPPSRFVGNVTVNGSLAGIDRARRGPHRRRRLRFDHGVRLGQRIRYALDVPALDPVASPGCGAEGSVVDFYVGRQEGRPDGELEELRAYDAEPDGRPGNGHRDGNAGAPVTGNSSGPGGGNSMPLVAVMFGAMLLGLGGAGVAAQVRNR